MIDLCRLCVSEEDFGEALLQKKGKVLLSDYRAASAAKVVLEDVVKTMVSELFQDLTFKAWRSENEKSFLKEKRKEEKVSKSYQKPYIEYSNTFFFFLTYSFSVLLLYVCVPLGIVAV